jgi:glycosyltransferase involved in cell wall biosynthesis
LSIYVIAPKTGRVKIEAAASPRVILMTDAPQVEAVPEAVRRAADMFSTEDLGVWRGEPWKGGATGALAWVAGDQLLRGTSADLRRAFFSPVSAATLVPVHLPCLAEADLIGLQPRMLCAGAAGERPETWDARKARDNVTQVVRVAGAANPSPAARQAWKDVAQPWAQLHLALLAEAGASGAAEPLKELWRKRGLPPRLASLTLRNLVVVLLRRGQLAKAEELLTLGMRAYPGYAELDYLAGVLWLYRRKPAKAKSHLERAVNAGRGGYVGSGGESSYRSLWLLGTIYEGLGEQDRALSHFLPGVYQRPAFGPSAAGILRQRFSRARAENLHQPLGEMVRREPGYLAAVFDFFLRHDVLAPPRRLLRTLPLPEELREALQARLASAERRLRPAARLECEKPGVVLEGSFLLLSGHARINQAVGGRLLEEESLDAALEPSESGTAASRLVPRRAHLEAGLRRLPGRRDLTIRHHWPPDFRPPDSGRLACILPWEHRAVPRAWVREIARSVDELWVPSRFVAEAFAAGGVDAARVQVIPNGFDPAVFHPRVRAARPQDCRGCLFLFVGGTIRRKGVDLLLQAYSEAFSGDDDVTLLFKENGASTFYRHNNLLPQVHKMAARSGAAPVHLVSEEMDDAALAALYRGCDALVLPYRGEGFGMPLLEAMACGRPVVTTAAGPAPEFCPAECSYLVPAAEVPVSEPPPPFGEFTGEWTWFEPNVIALAEALRSVYENRAEAARRGEEAAKRVARTHAWAQITPLYLERIAQLNGSPCPAEEPALAAAQP